MEGKVTGAEGVGEMGEGDGVVFWDGLVSWNLIDGLRGRMVMRRLFAVSYLRG